MIYQDHQHATLGADISGGMIRNIVYRPADQAGMKNSDIILAMNNIDIYNVEEFMKLLDQLPKEKYSPFC